MLCRRHSTWFAEGVCSFAAVVLVSTLVVACTKGGKSGEAVKQTESPANSERIGRKTSEGKGGSPQSRTDASPRSLVSQMEEVHSERNSSIRFEKMRAAIQEYGSEWYELLEKRIDEEFEEPEKSRLRNVLAWHSVQQAPALFYDVFNATGPGKDRETLFAAACRRLPRSEDIVNLIARLENEGFPEDIAMMANELREPGAVRFSDAEMKKLFDRISNPSLRNAVAEGLAYRYVQSSSGDALTVPSHSAIAKVVPDDLAEVYAKTLYGQLVRRVPGALPKILEMTDVEPSLKSGLMAMAASSCLRTEGPGEAMKRASALPDGWREAFSGRVMQCWLLEDSMSATRSLSSVPDGAVKDNMIIEVVRYTAQHGDHEGAQKWAGRMSDRKLREQVLAEVESQMHSKPPGR